MTEHEPTVHPVVMMETAVRMCGVEKWRNIYNGHKSHRCVFARAILCWVYSHYEDMPIRKIQDEIQCKQRSTVNRMIRKIDNGDYDQKAEEISTMHGLTFKQFAEAVYNTARGETDKLPSHRWPPKKIGENRATRLHS